MKLKRAHRAAETAAPTVVELQARVAQLLARLRAAGLEPPAPPPKFEPFIPHKQSVGILGVSQSGKSWLTKDWNGWLMDQGVPLVWWDAKGEHGIACPKHPDSRLGPLRQCFTVPEFLKAVGRNRLVITRRDLALSIRPSSPLLTPEERVAEFRSIMRYVLGRGRCVLGIEEASQLSVTKDGTAALVEIASVWPEYVSSIFVAQVPTMVPTQVRANWWKCISFAQAKATDRQTLSVDFGKPFADALEFLGPGQCLVGHSRPGWVQ